VNEPRLTEFLLRLALNDSETQRFLRGPQHAREMMAEAGLSDDQIDAVLSRDSSRIQVLVIEETGDLLPAIFCGKVRMHEILFEAE